MTAWLSGSLFFLCWRPHKDLVSNNLLPPEQSGSWSLQQKRALFHLLGFLKIPDWCTCPEASSHLEGGHTIKASIVPQCYCTNIYYAVKIRDSGPLSRSLVNTSVISCATELPKASWHLTSINCDQEHLIFRNFNPSTKSYFLLCDPWEKLIFTTTKRREIARCRMTDRLVETAL